MIFRRATIRLTVTYTVIQLAIFAIFAIGVYTFVTGTFDFDAAESDGEGAVNAAEQGFALMRTALIIFYACLLIVIPLSSWLMARSALKPIRASFERQQQFVDGASHEMRTPLSIIQGELELALIRSRTPAEYQAAITVALAATDGIIRLTDDLLKLSRTSKEELSDSFTLIDLNQLLPDLADAAAAAGRRADIHVALHTVAEPLRVRGSAELLSRAIGNVLDNALKFSRLGGTVTLSASTESSAAVIRVVDDGVGMTPAELAHAFDRFWRAETSRTTPGHGLGLALTRQIMHAHDGTITLASQPGQGSTVTLRLPTATR